MCLLPSAIVRPLPRVRSPGHRGRRTLGCSHTAGGSDGGQAEHIRVPHADVRPGAIPGWMDPDDAELMQEGSATPLHRAINAVKKGEIVPSVGVRGPIDTLISIGDLTNKGPPIRAHQASVMRLLPRLIEPIENGHINSKALITHRISLGYVSDACRPSSARLDGGIKPIRPPPRPGPEGKRHG